MLFFFFGMVLFTASCTLRTSVHRSSGTSLARSSPLNLLVTSTVNSYGLIHMAGLVFFPAFFSLSLNLLWEADGLSHSQLQVLCLLTVCSFSYIFVYKECSQFDFGIDHLVMSMRKVVSCVAEKVCLLWPVHSLMTIQLAFALLHFVLQGKTCLLLQVSLDFLLLHCSLQWWIEHPILC